jgi:chromosome segregation ATPase
MDVLRHASGAEAEPSDGSRVDGLDDDPYFAGIYEPFDDEKFLQVSALARLSWDNYIKNTTTSRVFNRYDTDSARERLGTQVMAEASIDVSSAHEIKAEFERLRSCLTIANDKERMLVAKCAALATECRAQASKMEIALNLSQEDQSTIEALKDELEKAWAKVDESHESEMQSKRTVNELKMEIAALTQDNDVMCDDEMEDEIAIDDAHLLTPDEYLRRRVHTRRSNAREVESLLKTKENLTAERDELLEETIKLREDIDKLSERTREAESAKLDLDIELQNVKDAAFASATEVERQGRAKDRLQRELNEVKESAAEKESQINDYKSKIAKSDGLIRELERNMRLQERRADASQKELNVLASKSDKLHRELNEAKANNKSAEDAITSKMHEINLLNSEIKRNERELDKLSKNTDQLASKLRVAEQAKLNADESKNELKRDVHLLEQQLEQQKRDLNNETRQKNDLMRERDVLIKAATQAQNVTSQHQDLLRIHEAQRQTLENEIKSYKMEQAKQELKLKQLDQQRSQLKAEVEEANSVREELEESLRAREARIVELQQELHDAHVNIKRAEHNYDAMRAERNQKSKELISAQAKIADVKREYKTKTCAIERLQEELHAKDVTIANERFEHQKLDKDRDSLRRQNDKLNATLRETQEELKHTQDETKSLQSSLASLNESRAIQNKQLDAIKRDRDVLNTQLVQRNKECALLYEKVKIQQKILNQGQTEYRERIREIKMLKLRLTSNMQELASLREAAANIDALKHEIQTLNRELLHERTRVKALSEELENPLNVHRWRKLQGSDPAMYELIQKVQALQRRLIAKSEEVTEKEILLGEKTKVLEELRVVLSRQPGPQAFEDLRDTRAQIKEKTRQVKCLQGELKMFIAHRDAYTHELGMLHDELTTLRKRNMKRRGA